MPKLTRAEQDGFLVPVVIAARSILAEPFSGRWAPEHTLSSFRAALRLDDPVLDELIEKHGDSLRTRPWSSPARPRDLATMEA